MKDYKGGNQDLLISRLFSFFYRNKKEKTNENSNNKIGIKKEKKSTIIQNNITETKQIINKSIVNNEKDIKSNDKEDFIVEPILKLVEEKKEINKSNISVIEPVKDETINNFIKDSTENKLEDTKTNNYALDYIILKELEKEIKQDYYETQKIEYELKVLNQQEKDEVLLEKVEKLQKQLEDLITKFDQIDKKYNYVDLNLNFDKIIKTQSPYVSQLIKEYKNTIINDNDINKLTNEIKSIKEYIIIIKQMVNIEKDKTKLKDNIDKKLDKFQIRDKEFEQMKDDFSEVEEINDTIKKISEKQNAIIDDLTYKVKNSVTIKSEIEKSLNLVPNFNKLFQAALLVATSKKIPPTKKGTMLKIGLVINAVRIASHFIETKEVTKEVKIVKFINYEKDINLSIENIEDTITTIDDTFLEIDILKENFKKNFEEYRNFIPEYDEMIKNIDNIEKELIIKQDEITKYNEDFNKILENNTIKIKKIDEIN